MMQEVVSHTQGNGNYRVPNLNYPPAMSSNSRSSIVNIPGARTGSSVRNQNSYAPGTSNTDYMAQSADVPSGGIGTPRSIPMSPMSPFEFSPVLESTHMRSMVQKHGPLLVPITRVMPQGDWSVGFTVCTHKISFS